MARPSKDTSKTYLEKLEDDIKSNNSPFSLILGALIVLVVGILLFNFFKGTDENITPTGETTEQVDVSPDKLPGKYTVKEDDTLFLAIVKLILFFLPLGMVRFRRDNEGSNYFC